jgi:hypothetical protein
MTLSIETIRAAEDNERLFDLLSGELQRLLSDSITDDRDLFQYPERCVLNEPQS